MRHLPDLQISLGTVVVTTTKTADNALKMLQKNSFHFTIPASMNVAVGLSNQLTLSYRVKLYSYPLIWLKGMLPLKLQHYMSIVEQSLGRSVYHNSSEAKKNSVDECKDYDGAYDLMVKDKNQRCIEIFNKLGVSKGGDLVYLNESELKELLSCFKPVLERKLKRLIRPLLQAATNNEEEKMMKENL